MYTALRSSTCLTFIGLLASVNSLMSSELLMYSKAFPHSLHFIGLFTSMKSLMLSQFLEV